MTNQPTKRFENTQDCEKTKTNPAIHWIITQH